MDAAHDRPAQTKGRKPVTELPTRDAAIPSSGPIRVSVSEGYRRWAATYDCSPNPLLALEERCLESVIPDLTGEFVLDLACGTGRWFEGLSRKRASAIVGSDLSESMLLQAAKKTAKGSRLVRADVCHLPYADARFDFALCSFAVGHIGAVDLFASECARVLKSQGELLVTDLHPRAYAAGWRTGFRDRGIAVEVPSLPRSSATLVSTFATAGFACREIAAFSFGLQEEAIFRLAGKLNVFESARRRPAICLYRFIRTIKPGENGEGINSSPEER